MNIVTWNVNSLTARWDRVSNFLTTRDVDVLLLQETKQNDAKFPTIGFADLGYETYHVGQGQWNGVAIASRVGLERISGELGLPDEEARYVAARCGGITVISVYVPNGRSLDNPHYAYKLDWLEHLARDAADRVADDVVIAGDFNVAPADLDVYDPADFVDATHVSVAERRAVAALADLGYVDAQRHVDVTSPAFTWWDYRQGAYRRNRGLRIDLLWCSPSLAPRIDAVWVDREEREEEKPSDHAPVALRLN